MDGANPAVERRCIRKVAWRLLPFLFILYVVAFLDRVNFGYAALEMNASLGLSSEVFGFLSGIFFLGYFLFEVPSNVLLERIGARIWIARILITWGAVVIATALAQNAVQLGILRFVLGLAEAGFFPGVILYITLWFRERELARAVALFMTALPVSNIIGAPVSTWILDNIGWFGIEGWRWLFVLEGAPAILFGVVTWFYLTDRPENAAWLDREEKTWLTAELAGEMRRRAAAGKHTLREMFVDPRVWHLSAIYCTLTVGLYGLGFWMPQIVRSLSATMTNLEVGLVTMIPYIAGCAAMVVWSRRSDAAGERRIHAALPPLVGGLGLLGSGLVADPFPAVFMLTVATIGIYSFFGPFWTLPALFLSSATAAVGIAVINSVGNLGGLIGPSIVGWLTGVTGSSHAGLLVLGASLLLSSLLVYLVRVPDWS